MTSDFGLPAGEFMFSGQRAEAVNSPAQDFDREQHALATLGHQMALEEAGQVWRGLGSALAARFTYRNGFYAELGIMDFVPCY